MSEEVLVTKNDKDEYLINADAKIESMVDQSIGELLQELRTHDTELYQQTLELLNEEKSHQDLHVFLLLLQTVFAKFSFNIDFEKNKWQEIRNTLASLKSKYGCYPGIIEAYLTNVKLEEINPSIKDKKNVQKEINRFLLDIFY